MVLNFSSVASDKPWTVPPWSVKTDFLKIKSHLYPKKEGNMYLCTLYLLSNIKSNKRIAIGNEKSPFQISRLDL